jgi:simple sugar transport system ATP-binding protein
MTTPERELDPSVPAAGGLVVSGLSVRASGTEPGLAGLELRVAPGEIVGVAGVEGNGQRPLVAALAGLARPDDGRIVLDGRALQGLSTQQRRRAGLRVIPFERNSEGVSLSSPLWQNYAALELQTGRGWFVSPHRMRRECEAALRAWSVKAPGADVPAGSLSGGNVQRLILSRELGPGATLLVAAQPSRGLDIGATEFVHSSIRELASTGVPAIVVSSDLDELFELSHRLVVMLGGSLVAEFTPPYSLAALGAAMTGATS